jgi:tetratricopeptide (TPR) repeat protein
LLFVLLAVAGGSAIALMLARRPQPAQAERASPLAPHPASAYADPSSCSTCHDQIARTYSLTGMARGFAKVSRSELAMPGRVYHKASDRYYTMVERDGKFYQRRHQIGFDGQETNVLELEAHFVVGSGNHARTFVHRSADGRLRQLPVSWYSNEGQGARGKGQGYWAMSPGYDKPAHLDFRRVIDAGCMSCHNGYPPSLAGSTSSFGGASPQTPVEDDRDWPRFTGALPEGIDCQRCHGPGQAHIEAVKAGEVDASRLAIVNPATLDRERQMETCMQCHLESTSSPLPFQIQRYEHPPFSYAPGKRLGDYFIHFDHAPGTPRLDDKFEIAGGAYRLRKSACFQRSEMTCTTCHDPHDVPRGAKAVERYVAVCQSCHEAPHRGGVPQLPGVSAKATCLDCHMPKRRTEDAVHVVMTDHYIQRERPRGDLLAVRSEADSLEHRRYYGEVVLYYPPELPPAPESDLYLALAQVQQGSNLKAGIERLEAAITAHRPSRPDFYYELARAYAKQENHGSALRWSGEALRRDPAFVPALKERAAAAMATGQLGEAADALEKAAVARPRDSNALADLGNVYLQQGRVEEARDALARALALDPDAPRANNTIGLTLLRQGYPDAAGRHFREAIRVQPDLAEAHNNLGNLLAGRNAYAEAAHHFEKAVGSDPNYVDARHSYGVVLALMRAYPRAAVELEATVRLAPHLAAARLDLADVLAALGRVDEARAHLEAAAKSGDAEAREAALAGLRALARPRQNP